MLPGMWSKQLRQSPWRCWKLFCILSWTTNRDRGQWRWWCWCWRWGQILELHCGWWPGWWPQPGEKLTTRFSSSPAALELSSPVSSLHPPNHYLFLLVYEISLHHYHILPLPHPHPLPYQHPPPPPLWPAGAIPAHSCLGQVGLWQGGCWEQVEENHWQVEKLIFTTIAMLLIWWLDREENLYDGNCSVEPGAATKTCQVLLLFIITIVSIILGRFGKRPPFPIWRQQNNDRTQVLVRRKLQGYRAVGARYSFDVEEQVSSLSSRLLSDFMIITRMYNCAKLRFNGIRFKRIRDQIGMLDDRHTTRMID